jgi:hypothetical protein
MYKLETNKQTKRFRKMKNVIIASVVASIAASSAFANSKGPLPVTKPAPAAASVASFDPADVKWEGTVSDLQDGCVFSKNENGKMSYTENATGGGVWEVYQKALVDVSVRGKSTKLSVEADSAVVRVGGVESDQTTDGHDMHDVTVDYTGGDMPTTINRSYRVDSDRDNNGLTDMTTAAVYSEGKIDIANWAVGKHNKIELGGTATMVNDYALIDNGDYELRHTVTCLQ